MALSPGTRIGSYEVAAAIGAGGMGEVYRARDTRLKREVALKILPASFASDPDRLARFQREAEVLASLNHPNIAAIYGLEEGPAEAGPHIRALVMELVEGETLADRIARGAIPTDEALPIAKQIAEALEAAHEQGIIHRDLKPANVKLRPDGTVKVLDFGLAKLTEPGFGTRDSGFDGSKGAVSMSPTITSPALMTGVGVLLGTAAYMAPEQAKGRPADKRSDIWAFGCVLFEMLTAKRAFEGGDVADTLASVLRAEPDWSVMPAATPALIETLVHGCLKKDPRERIRDVSTVLFLLTQPPAASTRIATVDRSAFRRRRALPVIAAAAVFTIVGALAGWYSKPPLAASIARFSIPIPADEEFPNQQVVAISPDGTHFAYISQETAAAVQQRSVKLLLRSITDFDSRPIVSATTSTTLLAGIGSPFFSPDGQWVGFWSAADSTLKKISVNGGPALTICKTERPSGPVWDGGSIVFAVTSKGIMRVSAMGGEPEVIAEVTPPQQVASPQLLDAGQSVLFTLASDSSDSARWDKAKVIVQSLASKQRKVVLQGGSDARYLSSGHLVYSVGSTLFAAPFDEKNAQLRGNPTPVLDGVRRGTGAGISHFSVSSSGTLVYVPGSVLFGFSDVNQHVLALVDRDGTEHPLQLPPQGYAHPRFSPDGKQLVVGIDDGNDATVWIVEDLRTQPRLRRLTFDGHNRYPIWSPDGRDVVFQSDRAGDRGLFRQLADGSRAAERLTTAEGGAAHAPGAFTPDGRTLAFQVSGSGAGTSSIWTVGTDGDGKPKPIESGEAYTPVFSPDGRWLAYSLVSVRTGPPNLFLQPFPPTGAKYQLTTTVGNNATWSPDGRQIFYDIGPREPWITAIDVRTSQGVTSGSPVRIGIRDPREQRLAYRFYDISPDGKQFVVVLLGPALSTAEPERATQINVVVNWLEELKARVPVK